MMRTLSLLLCVVACGADPSADAIPDDARPPEYEPPVALNADRPVVYPVDLFEQRVEGTVRLRLYLLEDGTVIPESTQVAEPSGYPALDSAALAGVAAMTFSPARRMGVPVATAFIQPIHFRHPEGLSGTGLSDSR